MAFINAPQVKSRLQRQRKRALVDRFMAEMVCKCNDGSLVSCFRVVWLCLAAWAIYSFVTSTNTPGVVVLIEVVEVLLPGIFLATMARIVF